MSIPCRLRPSPRAAHTLIELIVGIGISTILVGGLASSLLLSTRTLQPDSSAAADNNRASLALSQLTDDMQHAIRFTERAVRAVTFETPDRNNDGAAETIRYWWSGVAGDPLLYQYNGGAAVALAGDVQSFNLASLLRTIPATILSPPTPNFVTFEAFNEGRTSSGALSVTIPAPAGESDGKLLIAAVAVDGAVGSLIVPPSGWNSLGGVDSNGQAGLAVWWKMGTASEPADYSFTWTGLEKAYGWIMRFHGVNTASPIHASATAIGASNKPECPAITAAIDNTLILRIGGFDDGDIYIDNPGMANHTAVTMDRSDANSGSASGGAAYQPLAKTGSSGTASFNLAASQEFVTFTIAIAPLPPE